MVTRRATLSDASFADFGALLRVLRKRAGLTQRQLGIAVGYSEAQISRLEQGKRLPDPASVAALFLSALRLGGEPDLAARLHELAIASRAGRSADAAAAGPRPADPRAADLAAVPPAPSHQVKRASVLAGLREFLATERSVQLIGLPGTGKTSLATDLARERAAVGPVCWVTLTVGITTSAEAVVRRLARFLCGHGHDELAALTDRGQLERPIPRDEQLYLITTALSRSGGLICVDNVHLLRDDPAAVSVIEHIAASSSAELLAVGREELPLAGFAPFRLGGLAPDEARELVTALAGPEVSARAAESVIERTRGNPMLIRLAVGKLRVAGPAGGALMGRLESEPGIVASLLHATLGDLSEPGRRILRLLAVFRHSVDLTDTRLIEAGDALGGVDELRRRQLIDLPVRAELHPLIRDHAYPSLASPAADRDRLHRLAARYCESALDDPLEASWHYARGGDPAHAADVLSARTADLIARDRVDPAADLISELLADGGLTGETQRQLLVVRGDLLVHTERAAEAEDAYRQALIGPATATVRADIAWRLAQCLLQRGKVREALAHCGDAADGLTEDHVVLRAQLAAVRARAHLMLSEFDRAAAVARQAVTAAERIAVVTPDIAAAVAARAYWVLGVAERLCGRPQEAIGWLRLAADRAHAAGLREVAGRSLFNLGAIAHETGETGRAEKLYAEALAELRLAGDGYGKARVLHGLGVLRSRAGARDEAIKLFDEARALKMRMGDPLGAATSEQSLAHILLAQGQTEAARALIMNILDATKSLGERVAMAQYLDSLATVDLIDGDPAAARRRLAEAASIAAEVSNPILGAYIRLHDAFAVLAAGDLAAATNLAQSVADEIAAATGQYAETVVGHLALTACLALAAGDLDAVHAATAELTKLATSVDDMRYRDAARRIAVAASAQAREPEPAAALCARLPRLVWVADSG